MLGTVTLPTTWRTLAIACLVLNFSVPAGARAAAPPLGEKVPIQELLNEDGTLNLATGFSGTLDPAGFRMTAGPNGEPRFLAEGARTAQLAPMSCDPDQSWDDRFYPFGLDSTVWAIALSGSDVYVGGEVQAINDLMVNHIAKWNGSSWSALGTGMNGGVESWRSTVAGTCSESGHRAWGGGTAGELAALSASLYIRVRMDRYVNVTEARRTLLDVVENLEGGDRVVITKHGRPRAVVVDFERYAMLESVARVLQDPGHRAAMQRSWDELQAGRLVRPPRGARPSVALLRKLAHPKTKR